MSPDTLLGTRIDFSDEQALLLEAASRFWRERSPGSAVRALLADDAGFDRGLWADIVQLGWTGLAVPERLGGSGLPVGHLAVIAEPMGRHLLATPFGSTPLFIAGLLAGGQPGQQDHWLPRACTGAIGTVALFEDDGSWALEQPACRADLAGGTATLSGHKTLVLDAAVADALLASVMLDGAPALALLAAAELPPGRLQRETVIDGTRRCHRLDLDGLQPPAAALITGAAAQRALRAMRETAWLLGAAEAAGGIAGVLAVVVDYLNLRSAFGRRIGSYQALKHPCVDMLVGWNARARRAPTPPR